jgi:hypothetical protein
MVIQYALSIKSVETDHNWQYVSESNDRCPWAGNQCEGSGENVALFNTVLEAEACKEKYIKRRTRKPKLIPLDRYPVFVVEVRNGIEPKHLPIPTVRQKIESIVESGLRGMEKIGCLGLSAISLVVAGLLSIPLGVIVNDPPHHNSSDVNFFPTKLEAASADVRYDEKRFDECKADGDLDGMAKQADQLQKDRDRVELLKANGETK